MNQSISKNKSSRLLIVSKERSFITDSMILAIEESGVKCIIAGTDIKEIEEKKDQADMLLLYVNDNAADLTNIHVFLKDICADDAKPLYLAGHKNDIEKVLTVIPQELVRKVFYRPIEMKKLVAEVVAEAAEVKKRHSAKKILIVDDDLTFLKIAKKWLMGKYQVTIVKSGIQAIKFITAHRPDLILMDYDMPITSGSKVLEMIRSEPDSADIPVIFLTGKADKETVMQVMSLNPQGYLLKSMTQADIVSAIDHYFETAKWQNAAMYS